MTDEPHPTHELKRIQLPSGKTIEVVRFSSPGEPAGGGAPAPETAAPAPETAAPAAPARELHRCPECGSGLVYPVDWSEAGPEHWTIVLRCPECEWHEHGDHPQAVADRFDEELERGAHALMRDLRRLARANMLEDIERFTAALAADAIQPMDF